MDSSVVLYGQDHRESHSLSDSTTRTGPTLGSNPTTIPGIRTPDPPRIEGRTCSSPSKYRGWDNHHFLSHAFAPRTPLLGSSTEVPTKGIPDIPAEGRTIPMDSGGIGIFFQMDFPVKFFSLMEAQSFTHENMCMAYASLS